MLKNAIKIVLGVKNFVPKIWRFSKKVVHILIAYVIKNVGKNRAKRFLENSSFLVRVAIYFLIPHKEFKTEKILHPTWMSFFKAKREHAVNFLIISCQFIYKWAESRPFFAVATTLCMLHSDLFLNKNVQTSPWS